MDRKFRFHDGQRGAALAVRVTPKARQNKIIGVTSDGAVRIHLTAASSDADFNLRLEQFIADILGVDVARVSVVAGEEGNDKLVSVVGMTKEEVHEQIVHNLD